MTFAKGTNSKTRTLKAKNKNSRSPGPQEKNKFPENCCNYLNEELSLKTQEMQAILNGTRLLMVNDDFIDTARAIFDYCRELTGAKAGYIALLNKDKMENEILFLEPGGFFCNVAKDLPMPIRGFRSLAFEKGKTVYINNFNKSEYKKLLPKGHITLHNVMFAPIKIKGEIIGLMGLGEKEGDFDERDKRIVTTLSELTSIALSNARIMSQLKESREELSRINNTKDKFFSIIAHDLKNPFAAMCLSSELMLRMLQKKDLDTGKVRDYITVIAEAATTGRKLLENLLKWSMSQFGNIEFKPVTINLGAAVRESLVTMSNSAKNKKIAIHTTVPPHFLVQADPVMIETVLRNLISNAIKFTKPKGKVLISARRKNDTVLISIKDNGIGIPENVLKNLFRIDYKYTSPGTASEKGTGLGLILCKEFVQKHGQNITVKSKVGKGSEFVFTMQAAEA